MKTSTLPTDKLLLTRREVADVLNLSERTVHTLTQKGVLKTVRFGARAVRYPLDAIRDAISQQLAGVNGK